MTANNSKVEHEASTSKIEEEQLFYFLQRGIDLESAVRDKGKPANLDDAKRLIKNTKDIKDLFWRKVFTEKLSIGSEFQVALKALVDE